MSTEPIYCDDCQAAVRIEREPDGTLYGVCACGNQHPLKTSSVFPEGWR